MSTDGRSAGAPSASAGGAPALPTHDPQDPSSDIRRARAQAFAEVVEHRPYLYALMRAWKVERDVADDLVSMVVERYADRGGKADPVERVRSYLKVMARNALLDHQRRRFRETLVGEQQEMDQILEAERPADHVVADSFAAQELMLKISSLPPRTQIVLTMIYFDGLSVAEVADRLGMTPGTARRYLHRAVQRLRELYDQASAREMQETASAREAQAAAAPGRGAS
ncbi:RNA polymerase sigma factor [Streptomyces clavifer]|uniref:RNA polymerase sigma factor n=1 Tax=Streptomyces clavifer TaxID=68188 RepID=UPI0037111270